jgi:hypothetical protein
MKGAAISLILLPTLLLSVGCSSKLSRRQAERQIDAMMKPHPVGQQKKVMSPGGVPGFYIDETKDVMPSSFLLDTHKEYGDLVSSSLHKSRSSDDNLLYALNDLGYVNVQEEGPKTVFVYGTPLSYAHSRSVRLTEKVGAPKGTGYSQEYASGFSCYPPPNFTQCSIPPLIEMGHDYKITGIVQDDTHAKVNILIPWKLTALGLALQPYAKSIEVSENKLDAGKSDYYDYPALYAWEHLLNSHTGAGNGPATILFQKFDDGWRIVDENGKSEKDFN